MSLHPIEKLYTHLHSSAQGLTQAEAVRRQARYGANQLEKIAGTPLLIRLFREFTHYLKRVDIVIVSTAAPKYIIHPEQIEDVIKERKNSVDYIDVRFIDFPVVKFR